MSIRRRCLKLFQITYMLDKQFCVLDNTYIDIFVIKHSIQSINNLKILLVLILWYYQNTMFIVEAWVVWQIGNANLLKQFCLLSTNVWLGSSHFKNTHWFVSFVSDSPLKKLPSFPVVRERNFFLCTRLFKSVQYTKDLFNLDEMLEMSVSFWRLTRCPFTLRHCSTAPNQFELSTSFI